MLALLIANWSDLGESLRASKTLLGRCEIVPLDSMTLSVGLALLVEKAAQAAEGGASLEEVVHQARSQLSHVYSVFYVNGLAYLRHTGLLSDAQTILGTMLDIKPFLTIEEGELIPMEKVRTQAAVDKIVEFVAEFSALEQLVILHSAPPHRAHTPAARAPDRRVSWTLVPAGVPAPRL